MGDMDFPFGQTVFRDRRGTKVDPYNPSKTRAIDEFDPELTIELAGAQVASTSSTALRNATRTEILTAKSLYLTDVDADVREGDRIRVGGSKDDLSSGVAYMVTARPASDVNPFTGWQPVVEIPLENVKG